jgi:hypothetical protein
MSELNVNRRNFLKKTGFVLLSIQVIPLVGAQAGDLPAEGFLTINSGVSKYVPLKGDHWHVLNIPVQFLRNPPEKGVKVKTEWAYSHYHSVKLNKNQLGDIARGETVTVEDGQGDHKYEIKLPS